MDEFGATEFSDREEERSAMAKSNNKGVELPTASRRTRLFRCSASILLNIVANSGSQIVEMQATGHGYDVRTSVSTSSRHPARRSCLLQRQASSVFMVMADVLAHQPLQQPYCGTLGPSSCSISLPSPGKGQSRFSGWVCSRTALGTALTFRFSSTCTPSFPATARSISPS
jgi:hypothetical protein